MGALFVVLGDGYPDVFEDFGNLAEHGVDFLKAGGKAGVYTVLYAVLVAHVVDHDGIGKLSDSLDAAFALFEAGRVPGKVDINKGLQGL